MREALLYEKLDDKRVRCRLCYHECIIREGGRGLCKVRENIDGVLWTQSDGRVISHHIDPIEKKPLYHFYPGSRAFSIGTPGCNLRCDWCQNWQISQLDSQYDSAPDEVINASAIVAAAERENCRSIAYTYTEPTIFFEYSYEISQLAHKSNICNVFVSNGYMSADMVELIAPLLDGINIDLKAFRETTYRRYTGGHLQPVLDNLKRLVALGIWVEVTTLVIPGINDDLQELQDIATFIATELGCDTPWHLSRFYPQYNLTDIPPTSPQILHRAADIGRAAGLKYVYLGNLGEEALTHCPGCREILIRRHRFGVDNDISMAGCCPKCGEKIAGIGMNRL